MCKYCENLFTCNSSENLVRSDVIANGVYVASKGENKDLLEQVGSLDLGELHFEVYEGKGGHLPGETVLIDFHHHVAFTGDIYVNIHGMTREQAEYNRYAPVLMTSVDTDSALCTAERQSIMQRLGAGEWKIYGSHGAMKEYNLVVDGK